MVKGDRAIVNINDVYITCRFFTAVKSNVTTAESLLWSTSLVQIHSCCAQRTLAYTGNTNTKNPQDKVANLMHASSQRDSYRSLRGWHCGGWGFAALTVEASTDSSDVMTGSQTIYWFHLSCAWMKSNQWTIVSWMEICCEQFT
jgi:hypothetical protein